MNLPELTHNADEQLGTTPHHVFLDSKPNKSVDSKQGTNGRRPRDSSVDFSKIQTHYNFNFKAKIMLQAYIPDVRAPGQLYIEETPEIKLCGKGLAGVFNTSSPTDKRVTSNLQSFRRRTELLRILLSQGRYSLVYHLGPSHKTLLDNLKKLSKHGPNFLASERRRNCICMSV